ncbi:MAG: carbohydrate kinase family protein [Eisenbergiella porci]|uniref:Carbohydrate kinase family protein n=1 Tax=Eisenbergiella porci TaxID=2652274 RepID=A0A6N7VWY6_9FIRM|nr:MULTISPECIES: carbohydrate kinase family protein [Eisenbergiella]MDY2653107.1 carbohydrate kinase family protein [Eisenbergiella porci]MSS87556.1 carbohydrate kinase family protein [Eisenbergiella porci]
MDVVGIGIPYYDMVINVSKMPGLDGAAGANEAFYQGGGKVATAMAAAARLGRSAGMMAKVGENHRGQFIINDFRYNGVDTSAIIVDAPGTSSPFCLSLSEEEHKTRIFIGKEGTAGELLPEEIDYEYLGKAKYLHLENGRPASAAAALFAREHGIVTVMDADNYQEGIVKLLPCLDVFIASEFFYRDMFGNLPYEEGCRKLLEAGPSTAIVTLGSRGSVGMTAQDGFFRTESFQVPVRDTTGAGDVFHGAYIVGLLEGMDAPECARFASAVSAIKCTCFGGRTGIPNRETVQRFLETGEIDRTEAQRRLAYYRNNL